MHDRGDFSYYNLRARMKSDQIDLLFPGWEAGNERVAVICPHDDDGLLGAGYALLAALANEAEVYPFILCNGCAGYSTPEEKESIVERRKDETVRAYQALGISARNIIRFDYPDFSLLPNIGWLMPWGKEGTFPRSLQMMRELRITRLLVPNGYREHVDHEAAYRIGAYDGPQVGDNILADWGGAPPIKSFLQYAVWGDLSPEDALVTGSDLTLRGNRAILARLGVEETVQKGIREFRSQERVVEGLIEARKGRRRGEQVIEVYLAFDPRPSLDYAPYHEAIAAIR
ncbi:MAG: PIG-L family deacetylase [Anaerolineae bacterium]